MLKSQKFLLLLGLFAAGANADIMSIQPTVKNVNLGDSFTLDVQITGTTDLYGYQFDVGFNSAVLSATLVSEGPFLPGGGTTSFLPGSIDNVGGTISFVAGIFDSALSGVSGNGVLATLSFTAIGTGSSSVSVFNPFALNSFGEGMPVTTVGGTVNVGSIPEPSSVILLGTTGLAALMALRRRSFRAQPI